MPLNGRSLQNLMTLVPGVATVPGSGQVGYQGEITVDGQRTESNYFTVDGVAQTAAPKSTMKPAAQAIQAQFRA